MCDAFESEADDDHATTPLSLVSLRCHGSVSAAASHLADGRRRAIQDGDRVTRGMLLAQLADRAAMGHGLSMPVDGGFKME